MKKRFSIYLFFLSVGLFSRWMGYTYSSDSIIAYLWESTHLFSAQPLGTLAYSCTSMTLYLGLPALEFKD